MKAYIKAIVPLLTAAVAVAIQWSTTGRFSVTAEFVTVAFGAGSSLLVLVTRNLAISRVESIRKALAPVGVALLAVFVQWTETRHFSISQEFVTSVLGLGTAVLVYYAPNAGSRVNAVGSLVTRHANHASRPTQV